MTAHQIQIIDGDLLTQDVHAIVNPANEHLTNGGGLARIIENAAGQTLVDACRQIIEGQHLVPTGTAVATTAGALPHRYVLHTPGPIWNGGADDEPRLLAASHRAVIALAAELGLSSVAFPAISCGIFGYPVQQAAPVAIGATAQALADHPAVTDVRFCLREPEHVAAFTAAHRNL